MEKVIIEWIEYVFISRLYNSYHDRYMVSLKKDGVYYRTREHIWIWMVHNKKHLPSWYIIHHINKDHKDNKIENLVMVTRWEHNKLHADDENHYMFREWHTYWSKPKSIEHKWKIKDAHIDRSNNIRKEHIKNATNYYLKNKFCTNKEILIFIWLSPNNSFKKRLWISFLDFKHKIENGEEIL